MTIVSIKQAQSQLPDLIHSLTPGDEVVITENASPSPGLFYPGMGDNPGGSERCAVR